MMAELEYKYVGNHAQDLADGRMLAPGEVFTLSDEEMRSPHNESLFDGGVVIPLTDDADHQAKLADRRADNRSKKQQASEGTDQAPGEVSEAPTEEE